MKRDWLTVLLVGLCCAATAGLQALTIDDVQVRVLTTEDFKRISEYFTGDEDLGRRHVVRSQGDSRDGLYWIVQLDERVRELPSTTQIEVEIIPLGEADAVSTSLSLGSVEGRSRELYVGLTGSDWNLEDPQPAAWRLTLRDANETVLAQRESFLWAP